MHVDLYRIAISHRASIHAMAAYASKSLDFLHCSEPTQPTVNHTMRAVRGVNEGLVAISKRVQDNEDGVIYSIAMLAAAEVGFKSWDGLAKHCADDITPIAPLWPI